MFFINQPKKKLGQNFLIDQNIIKKIVKIGCINKNKTVLEIGSGYGSLTKEILNNKPKRVLAIEKDKELFFYLKDYFKNFEGIKVINEDILEYIKKESFGKKIIVYGNLPYNISTQILANLILIKNLNPWYEILIFMFQKEVADRILAKSGSKNYGRLSILSNWKLDIKKHFDVSNSCFSPKPNINSTVLSFKPKKKILFKIKNPKNLEFVTRTLFSNRRKMINKSFLKLFNNNKNIADDLKINLKKRPEELSSETFYRITQKFEDLTN